MALKDEKLAIHGGPKAVTIAAPEQWQRPVEEEKKAVVELVEQGFLSGSGTGMPKEFEDEFARFVGAKFCLTVSQGSSGLMSALYAVGVGPGDEVIVPTAGYLGSYCGVLHLGARPVFCDIDPKTLLTDPKDAERRITPRTRAILPIHLCGRVADMDAFLDIGQRRGVAIVEDAAHAHGSDWDGKRIGGFGDIQGFSLQGIDLGGKPVSGGEGGIVTTNNREYYERQLIYCHLHREGIVKELTNPLYKELDSEVLGLKWRAHPLALALARVAQKSLPYRNGRRIENRIKLFDAIRRLPGIQPVEPYAKSRADGLYGGLKLIYKPEELGGLPAAKFVAAMKAEGAPVSGPGIGHLEHLRTIFTKGFDLWGRGRGPLGKDFKPYKRGDFPVAEGLAQRVLTIPSYIEPKDGFLDQFAEAFRKVTANYGALLGA